MLSSMRGTGCNLSEVLATEDIDAFLTSHDDLRHEVFKMIRAQRNEMAFEEQVFYPGCRFHEHEEGQPCSQRTAR